MRFACFRVRSAARLIAQRCKPKNEIARRRESSERAQRRTSTRGVDALRMIPTAVLPCVLCAFARDHSETAFGYRPAQTRLIALAPRPASLADSGQRRIDHLAGLAHHARAAARGIQPGRLAVAGGGDGRPGHRAVHLGHRVRVVAVLAAGPPAGVAHRLPYPLRHRSLERGQSRGRPGRLRLAARAALPNAGQRHVEPLRAAVDV